MYPAPAGKPARAQLFTIPKKCIHRNVYCHCLSVGWMAEVREEPEKSGPLTVHRSAGVSITVVGRTVVGRTVGSR